MAECDYCSKKIHGVLPHKCKFCGQIHCHSHILPESHNCVGLEKHKKRSAKKWKDVLTSSASHKYKKSNKLTKIIHNKSNKKQNLPNSIKNYFLKKYDGLIYWLRKREHYRYNYGKRMDYLITTILLFITSLAGVTIFYSNATRLNEINVWIVKLGGTLILISSFFAIKFGWRLKKEGINILKRQRNWLKYLIIILITFLLWQAYTYRNNVLNPVFEAYDKTNFSLFVPVDFDNLSLNSISLDEKNNSFISDIKEIFKSEPERKDETLETFAKLNKIRAQEGKKTILWDERAYNLSVARSKDMYDKEYFDHVTPEGKCADDFKKGFGFKSNEYVAENIGASMWESGSYTQTIDVDNQLNNWLGSRGHRYNLLYSTHKSGAIGCYYGVCVFLGVNNDGFGAKPCNTGDEGLAFWQTALKQPGEV